METASLMRYLDQMTDTDGLDDLRDATARRDAANEEVVKLAVKHLLDGKPPTAVAKASPWTEARLRVIAREHGVPPAPKGRKAKPKPPSAG